MAHLFKSKPEKVGHPLSIQGFKCLPPASNERNDYRPATTDMEANAGTEGFKKSSFKQIGRSRAKSLPSFTPLILSKCVRASR
jgi:hypothetical protein